MSDNRQKFLRRFLQKTFITASIPDKSGDLHHYDAISTDSSEEAQCAINTLNSLFHDGHLTEKEDRVPVVAWREDGSALIVFRSPRTIQHLQQIARPH